jgi:hypothetical protein
VKTPSKGFVVAILLIGTVCISTPFWARYSSADIPGHTKTGREKQNLESIAVAIRSYQEEFNEEPPASPEQFFASLRGANPKGYEFLAAPKQTDTETGIFLDEWRNHYQIIFRDVGWNISSAGRNRIWGGRESGDDISVVVPTIQKRQAEQ